MAKFQKGKTGNPSGRPKVRAFPVLAAVKRQFGGETEFWDHIAQAAKSGDQHSLSLLAARVCPPFKARSMCVELGITGDTAKDYTTGVLAAVAHGEIPPDEAASLLNAILAGDKLEKLEELEQRLNQLAERQHGND